MPQALQNMPASSFHRQRPEQSETKHQLVSPTLSSEEKLPFINASASC